MNRQWTELWPRRWWIALIIAAAALAAYLPALTAGYIWDDDAYVTQNATLHDFTGLRRIWFEIGATDQYYPLVFTTFWIERQLWGLAPLGYHVVNVLLHAASAFLLWTLLRRLAVPGALFAALLFALHPVHVESVAWITERKNVLSGVFYLSALSAWCRFVRLPGFEARRPRRSYAASLALFCCALLSKTVTATLPVVLLLLVWWKCGRIRRRDVASVVPLFALGAAVGAITVWMERHHVGTQYVDWNLSPADRVLIAGRAVWFYLAKLAWPAELIFIYPRWQIPGAPMWQFIAPAGVVAVLILAWSMRHRWGKGLFVAAAFFIVTLFPALGFIDVYPMRFSFVADHFQYLASIGPIALLAALAARLPLSAIPKRAGDGAVLLALAVLTWRQCGTYEDSETLWRDTARRNPEAWIAHGNLAAELAKKRRIDEAIDHYREGLRLKEDAPQVHYNLAVLLHGQDRFDNAIVHFERAIQLSPRYVEAHNDLAVCLAASGRDSEAALHYETALAIKPDHAEARSNFANLLLARGRFDEAIAHGRKAVSLAPDNPFFHFNLAMALAKHDRKEEAIDHFIKAQQIFETLVRTDPDNSRARAGLEQTRRILSPSRK